LDSFLNDDGEFSSPGTGANIGHYAEEVVDLLVAECCRGAVEMLRIICQYLQGCWLPEEAERIPIFTLLFYKVKFDVGLGTCSGLYVSSFSRSVEN
jgi:hypothetical protein